MKNFKICDLFTNCGVLNDFPFPIDDFDSLTQYEMLLKCIKHIKKLYENDSTLTNRINALANYIENLDLQDEVNNKIDEMVESGQLQEIITEYLQINGVLAFNTVSEMVNATNIIDGSICRTLGLNNYLDGKGEFYKIRTITSGDIVDEVNIIALNISNTLIAEKIPNYFINDLQNQIDDIVSEKIIFIGDSYGDNQNSTVDEFTLRLRDLMKKDNLTLTNNDFYIWNVSGARVIQDLPTTSTYLLQLQNNNNVISAADKLKVKKIFLLAGHNDTIFTKENILNALNDLYTYAKAQYPNANIYIGCIGYDKRSDQFELRQHINDIVIPAYKESVKFGFKYVNNVEYIMRDYSLYDTTNFHPNEDGHNLLARCIYNSLNSGNICDYSYETENVTLLENIKFDTNTTMPINYIKNNDKLNININGLLTFDTPIANVVNYDLHFNIAAMDNIKYFRFSKLTFNVPITCDVVYSNNTYNTLNGYIQFGVNNIRIYLFNNNPNTSLTIKGMRVYTDVCIDRINC